MCEEDKPAAPLNPLDLKQPDVGVVPDRRVNITAGRRKNKTLTEESTEHIPKNTGRFMYRK